MARQPGRASGAIDQLSRGRPTAEALARARSDRRCAGAPDGHARHWDEAPAPPRAHWYQPGGRGPPGVRTVARASAGPARHPDCRTHRKPLQKLLMGVLAGVVAEVLQVGQPKAIAQEQHGPADEDRADPRQSEQQRDLCRALAPASDSKHTPARTMPARSSNAPSTWKDSATSSTGTASIAVGDACGGKDAVELSDSVLGMRRAAELPRDVLSRVSEPSCAPASRRVLPSWRDRSSIRPPPKK